MTTQPSKSHWVAADVIIGASAFLERFWGMMTTPNLFSGAVGAALVAGVFALASSNRATDVELLKLSVSILQTAPNDSSRALRQWAVAVLNKYYTVPVPAQLQRALTDSQRLPVVSVSASGLVTALQPGTTRIVACSEGKCDTASILVPAADSIHVLRGRKVTWKVIP